MIREWNEESLDHRNTLLYAMGISEEDAKRPHHRSGQHLERNEPRSLPL